ncbi:MAG TPA: DUF1488 domain-containing protein [Burkholderiaceae bacterium]|jgi:hypothetical protein|nr:DUF1488 domain-containing protein [Burkholderiaceae bacterium]
MDIEFPGVMPVYHGADLRLAFPAMVDGRQVECRISAEALKDHFGAKSVRETDLHDAFKAHRAEIESAARWMLLGTTSSCIVLRSGTLRFMKCH